MSYELFVDGEPKGQVASFYGMSALTRRFEQDDSELGSFLRTGKTEDPLALSKAIGEVMDLNVDMDVLDILVEIQARLPDSGTVSISSE